MLTGIRPIAAGSLAPAFSASFRARARSSCRPRDVRKDSMTSHTAVIADDNAGMRLVARTLVEEAGWTVVAEAVDGEQAVRHALEHRPALVLMDYRMPGTDGLEATGRITAAWPQATVVVWTSTEDAATAERFFAAGASDYIVKGDVARLRAVLAPACAGRAA
ncbi:MAG: response regulator [Actinobacteria bacterium]|nr:MAG: response regulator [Actinomycetota bacterium]